MSEQEDIDRIVKSLAGVPPATLRIIELANRIPLNEFGEFDLDELGEVKEEVIVAIDEAKGYGAHTIRAVQRLENISNDYPGRNNIFTVDEGLDDV